MSIDVLWCCLNEMWLKRHAVLALQGLAKDMNSISAHQRLFSSCVVAGNEDSLNDHAKEKRLCVHLSALKKICPSL